MTHRYIGTKEVTAWSQNKKTIADPFGELDNPGYTVKYEDGYTSWSPKDVFEAAYRVCEGDGQALNFGDALHFLKLGKKVARAGWNGKGQWVRYFSPYTDKQFSIRENAPDPAIGDSGTFMPFLAIRTNNNQFFPWAPSQSDVLANDWQVL